MGERTTVIGTILAVVFQNEENGYTVARIVTDDGEPVTVVGCIPLRRARRGADPDRTLHDASAARRAVRRRRGGAAHADG